MLQPKSPSVLPSPPPSRSEAGEGGRNAPRPFFNAIDSVIVEEPAEYKFAGAISRLEARAVWTWLVRDIAPDLIDPDAETDLAVSQAALDAVTPDLLRRARRIMDGAAADLDAERRLRGQLGGSPIWQRLPAVLNALKCAPLLGKAKAFGRSLNGIQEDEALIAALQAVPRQDSNIAAVLMTAAIGQVANPTRLIVAATQIAGEASEPALLRAGFAPLVEAMLAHAQNMIPPLLQAGAFTDMDLICRAIERFHRLVRAINANVELSRPGVWAPIIAALTKTVSDRLEPKLRDLTPDLNQSLRHQREGADRLDRDGLLAALNGFYLLETVRECRDSLALNKTFDETWSRAGQVLEMHLTRNLETLRDHPSNEIVAARVDIGIKMAEVRFGAEYAQVLRHARDGVDGRRGPALS